MPGGYPWGGRTAGNCNPYNTTQTPNTGMTRQYHWTVTDTVLAPDGVTQTLITVNDQFPGPMIEANWGDWIEVTVKNNRSEGTSLHWHGFLQTGTPYMDGTPGISQCPIAPGSSFTYRFRAELYGTSWWHGHYSAQYINGLVGPIVVHGPNHTAYDIDLGPVMLTDWFHAYYEDLVHQIQVSDPFGPILPPQAQNVLINGKADFNCSNTNLTCVPNAGLAKFKFQSGKKHLIRLINHGAEGVLFFSIDGYKMTVVANDFVPLVPYETDLVTLSVGQRSDVIVEATGDATDAVWMRLTSGPPGNIPSGGIQPRGFGGCNIGTGYDYTTTAAIYYENADTSKAPNTTTSISTSRYITPFACQNDPLDETVPYFPIPWTKPDLDLNVTITGGVNGSNIFVWWMNNVTFIADMNDPLLLEAKLGRRTFDPLRAMNDWSQYKSVRINLTGVGLPAGHPMHSHGHNMMVLSSGLGVWDGSIVNPENPQRRDTHTIPPLGYAVLQWDLDNPGVWPFHCHIAWHTSEGMNLNFIEGGDILTQEMEMPYVMAQTCRDWSAWTGKNVVNLIDSGL